MDEESSEKSHFRFTPFLLPDGVRKTSSDLSRFGFEPDIGNDVEPGTGSDVELGTNPIKFLNVRNNLSTHLKLTKENIFAMLLRRNTSGAQLLTRGGGGGQSSPQKVKCKVKNWIILQNVRAFAQFFK